MLDDGCRSVGCSLTPRQKEIDAQTIAIHEAEAARRKCAKGNKNYCSNEKEVANAGKLLASVLIEPVDWVNTGYECISGDCSPWMLLGLLPGVPSSAAKRIPDLFSVIKYGDNAAGLAKHHGVIDVWAAANIPGYASRNPDAPTVVLTRALHEKTNDVFRAWRKETTGSITGKIDWTTVSPRTVQWLAEEMFDAAGVPQEVRQTYYNEFYKYLYEVLP
jgi:hypothetical protein